jgi:acetoin utilization protein AcuC
MNSKRTIHIIHSPEHARWIFDADHPTQGRRYVNAHWRLLSLSEIANVEIVEVAPRIATRFELQRVHSLTYVNSILNEAVSSEWDGVRPKMAHLASLFAGGTLVALDLLLSGVAKTAIHFPGAKHHAQRDWSSGFCIFNDFAIAADIATEDYGLRVAILDIDGHHGDGTENLTRDNPMVMTFSIHDCGIFPGTGEFDEPEFRVFNEALRFGDGDENLMEATNRFLTLAKKFNPAIIFIACGADGHEEDLLTGLDYSVEGIVAACARVRDSFPQMPILMGGAGGYLPDTRTPEVWARAALAIAI